MSFPQMPLSMRSACTYTVLVYSTSLLGKPHTAGEIMGGKKICLLPCPILNFAS